MSWLSYGARVVGEEHLANGMGCQDRIARWSTDHPPAIALADGMGSCPHAAHGAEAAVRAALYSLRWWQELPGSPVEPVIRIMSQRWLLEIHPVPKGEAKTTLLATAVAEDGRILVLQLGDGAILLEAATGVSRHAAGGHQDFANETLALGSQLTLEDWKWAVYPPGSLRGVVLASDGVANGLDPAQYAMFIDHLRQVRRSARDAVAAGRELKQQLRDWPPEAAGGDDRSIACLFQTGAHDD